MRKILVFGNSASGKSTLAKHLSKSEDLAHLDLDTLAWKATVPPQRKSIEDSEMDINDFIRLNNSWVIEGCYTDLLELAVLGANEIIFLNLPVEACINNAKRRPWESHKYESKDAQDANLKMLIDWISQYDKRTDTFSELSHQTLYDNFKGHKTIYFSNGLGH